MNDATSPEEPRPAAEGRILLRRAEKAFLSTLLAGPDGAWPYGSLVLVAHDHQGRPLFFFSDLSDHTRNLKADGRASVLVEETGGFGNPLAGPRAAYLGKIERIEDPALKERYFRRHPKAKLYRDFTDFALYRMVPERLHMIGGFAKAVWAEEDLILNEAAAAEIAGAEPGILDHMNADHADALAAIADHHGLTGGPYRMVGCDPEGFDLLGPRGRGRVAFPHIVDNLALCRATLADMAVQARKAGEKA